MFLGGGADLEYRQKNIHCEAIKRVLRKGFEPLSYIKIPGGLARHQIVSAKRWRILSFADATWLPLLMVVTTDIPRSIPRQARSISILFYVRSQLVCM